MKIYWRKSAIRSLLDLDRWRKEQDLSPMGLFLREHVNRYFQRQDFSVYVPGKAVFIQGYSIDLRMVLISVGASDPYKVFYRFTRYSIEIFMVRHPRQKSLV